MRKRIYRYILFISITCILVLSGTMAYVFYNFVSEQSMLEAKTEANILKEALEKQSNEVAYLESIEWPDRVTFIDYDGRVLYDNEADITTLDNHKMRKEVEEAIRDGYGEEKRYSETLSEETYYYAEKLSTGEVIRVAASNSSIVGLLYENIGIILVVAILLIAFTNFAAANLTNKIVEPFNKSREDDFEDIDYEELAPFVKKLKTQQNQLLTQVNNVTYQNNTILTITNNMQEGVVLLDKENNVLTLNGSAKKILDITSNNFVGTNIIDYFRDKEFIDCLKKLGKADELAFTYDKGKNIYRVSVSPVFRDKDIDGVVVLFVDVTKKEQMEKFRREFSANVSHELKTPLMSILGYSELMESSLVKYEDIPRFSSKIRTEANNMTRLVEDILLISELDEDVSHRGNHKNIIEEDITKSVEEVVERMKNFADNRNITIVTTLKQVYFPVNKKLFKEMIKNLIYNAIVYNVENGKIMINLYKDSGKLYFVIKDTGVGIGNDDIDRVFERFYRAEKSRNKSQGGTGLGLSIVKNVALYHNGIVSVDSELENGSTFKVVL